MTTIFKRALTLACALAIGAMLRYPGGTTLDHTTIRYSLTENFLSDLGMTVAFNGRANAAGAALFVLSVLLLVFAMGGAAAGLVRHYTRQHGSRVWAYGAAAFSLLACSAFVGVAMTPENLVMPLHITVTFLGWRVFAIAAVLLSVASLKADTGQRTRTAAWGVLAFSLSAYAFLLSFGPTLATLNGLRVQVVAQKIITVIAVALLTYLFAAMRSFDARTEAGTES